MLPMFDSADLPLVSPLDKNNFKNASAYVKKKFEKQIMDQTKNIYTHFTCAKGTPEFQEPLLATTTL